ncbi:hypothetical protein RCOM_0075880 [Ricinus communis]|uniref:Uncharacterized protein n=1 Tax=Ricinus communis TaxID=3988 RepID=B9SW95_RICCO|nr:hypothetical protein RCOM_0075880 [Ricinus communis]
MSNTIILSDDEDDHKTPVPSLPKKPRTIEPNLHFPTILVLDDDPTPPKPGPTTSSSSTPSFVPDTPMSDLSIVKCTFAPSNLHSRVSNSDTVLSGSSQFVCLESEDDESESGSAMENWKNSVLGISDDETDKMAWSDRLYGSMDMLDGKNDCLNPAFLVAWATWKCLSCIVEENLMCLESFVALKWRGFGGRKVAEMLGVLWKIKYNIYNT